MKKVFISFSLLLSFILTSCSALGEDAVNPPIQFDAIYLNQQIRLIAMKQLSPFTTRDPVAVHLEYDSENEIVFPSNYNIKTFAKQDGKWVEIKEKPEIRSDNKVILSPSIPISYGQIVVFSPALDDLTKTYYMRIYVFGDMTTPDGIKQVAAFVDFVLTP